MLCLNTPTHLGLRLALVLLKRSLVHNPVEEQYVPADGALARVHVTDKHDVHVLLCARHNGRGVDLQQKNAFNAQNQQVL